METLVGIIVIVLVGSIADHAIESAARRAEWRESVRVEQAEWEARAGR